MLTLFFRYPRLIIFLIGFIIVAGLNSLHVLPRLEDPVLTARWATVETYFPGAGAIRVEALITEKIENKLAEIEEIKSTNSSSSRGVSVVYIELMGDVWAVDDVWARVRDKISEIETEFPAGAKHAELTVNSTPAFTLLFGFTSDPANGDQIDIVGRLAKDLEHRLSLLPHTEKTQLFGVPTEEILVSVDAVTLASANLTVKDVAMAINLSNPIVPSGEISNNKHQLLVEVSGELNSIDRIRKVPVTYGKDDQMLTVGAVAKVEKTIKHPASDLASVNGQMGVILAVRMGANVRVDLWATNAGEAFERFLATLPKGVEAEIIFDQSQYTDQRMRELSWNLMLGAMLVTVVLLVMMGWRSALLVTSALPLTLLMVLPFFNLLDVSLHQVSITGLIIALGLLIDNAIITVDEYGQRRQQGLPINVVISKTVQRLFPPLLVSTITTALTFLPLVLMPGNPGEFVSTLGIAVILAISSSFLLSMTVIPALAGFSDTLLTETGRPCRRSHGISTPRLLHHFKQVLNRVLSRPWIGIGGSMVLPFLGFVASQSMVEQFFPPTDRNQFDIQIKLAPDASLIDAKHAVERVREYLHTYPEIKQSHWVIGGEPPRIFYSRTIKRAGVANFAWGFVTTESPLETKRLLPELQSKMMALFPEYEVLTLPYQQGPPVEAPIEVQVFGPDLTLLRHLGEQIRLLLSRTDKVTFTEASMTGGLPTVKVVANEHQVVSADLQLVELADQLSADLVGVIGGTIFEGSEELPIRIRVTQDSHASIDNIATDLLMLRNHNKPDKDTVIPGLPLNAVGNITLAPEANAVTRRDGLRSNTIQAYLEPFTLPGKSLADFKQRLAESSFRLPPGYDLVYGGENKESKEAKQDLMSVVIPLLIVMAGTIVMAFNSFRFAAVIASVGVLSIGTALFSAWTFGYPLGFMVIIGTMGLIGLAINDSIIVLTALSSFEFESENFIHQVSAIIIANCRHIISTTLTTIGAFLPLIWSGGDFWPPLATAVAGGMIGATLFALIFVPSCFVLIRR